MKINANKYEANEIMKIIREWTNLSLLKNLVEVEMELTILNTIEIAFT